MPSITVVECSYAPPHVVLHRLQEGVQRDGEPLPWDLLFALALMDALAGDADTLWGAWAQVRPA